MSFVDHWKCMSNRSWMRYFLREEWWLLLTRKSTSQSSSFSAFTSVAKSEEESDGDESATEAEDDLSLISRRIQRMLRRRSKGKKVFSRKGCQRNEGSKNQIICYECNKPVHIRTQCPHLKRNPKNYPKRKTIIATWDNSKKLFFWKRCWEGC